jgi:hypothetical protein
MGASFTIRLVDVLELEKDNGNGHKIGLAEYPIFDPDYREGLNRKIIQHFYMQEIGVETISLFTYFLRRRMNEIMPYWNQVYRSTQIEFDPLSTYDLITVRDETGQEISSRGSQGTNTSNGNSLSGAVSSAGSIASNTPQTVLSGNKDYATSANRSDSKSDTTAEQNAETQTIANEDATANTTGNTTSRTSGYQGSAANLLRAYRETLLNVDMLVIDQLEDLFMGIWNTQDSMMPSSYSPGPYLPTRGMLH